MSFNLWKYLALSDNISKWWIISKRWLFESQLSKRQEE